MKIKILLIFLLLGNLIRAQEGTHFRIYADIERYPFFKDILVEAMLDDLFTKKYQLVVNTQPEETAFIIIGRYNSPDVEWDRKAFRYDWLFLSKYLRDKLLNYPQKIILN